MTKKLNLTIKLLVGILALSAFTFTGIAQKKKVTTKRPTAPVVTNALEIRNGADKVSIQIKNVSKFFYFSELLFNFQFNFLNFFCKIKKKK